MVKYEIQPIVKHSCWECTYRHAYTRIIAVTFHKHDDFLNDQQLYCFFVGIWNGWVDSISHELAFVVFLWFSAGHLQIHTHILKGYFVITSIRWGCGWTVGSNKQRLESDQDIYSIVSI